jgi:formate dehydrogenase subunit gamma
MTFQYIASVCLIAAVATMPIHYVLIARRRPMPGLGERHLRRYNLWERLVHAVLVLLFLVLAWTGFYAACITGEKMTGYTLMIHTTSGAMFAVTVAISMVTWAADHLFGRQDGQWLSRGGCLSALGDLPAGRFNAGDKIYFWLAGLLTLVALLSMLLSMIPWLGTAGQVLMYETHRYSTLVLLILTIWHAYMTAIAKRGGLTAILSGYVSASWAERYHPLWGEGADRESAAGK